MVICFGHDMLQLTVGSFRLDIQMQCIHRGVINARRAIMSRAIGERRRRPDAIKVHARVVVVVIVFEPAKIC